MIITEIDSIEKKLLLNASDKERFFYLYLLKRDIQANSEELGEIDKICYAAFIGMKSEELDKIVERNRKSKPVAGSHFSSNLITMCAFALYDKKVEEVELKQFYSAHGFKEQFVLYKVFGNNYIPQKQASEMGLDNLIDSVLIKSEYTEGGKKIISALSSCNDLIELFLIKCIFNACAETHPNRKIEKENEMLIAEFSNFHSKITNRVDKVVNWIVGVVILGLIPLIYYFIVTYWQPLDLEPHLTALGIVLPLTLVAIFLVFKFKSTWEELLENIKSNVVRRFYRWNNINHTEIIKLIQRIEDK